MSIASTFTNVCRHPGIVGHVCVTRGWHGPTKIGGFQGTINGTKRQPQPMIYEGKAPDS